MIFVATGSMAMTGFACATTRRPPTGICGSRSASRGPAPTRAASSRYVFARSYSPTRWARVAPSESSCRRLPVSPVSRASDEARLDPPAHVVGAAGLPGGLGPDEQRLEPAGRLAMLLEDPDRRSGLGEGALEIAGHAMGPGEEEPRVAFDRPGSLPVRVEKGERRARRPRGVFDAEGLEGRPGEAQRVLDRLVGHVALQAVLDQLGQDSFDPPGMPRLEQLGGPAMQRPALSRRQAGVEHVVHDAAREAEQPAARLAFLCDEALLHEPVNRIVDLLHLGQRRQIAGIEAPADDRRDRQDVA